VYHVILGNERLLLKWRMQKRLTTRKWRAVVIPLRQV